MNFSIDGFAKKIRKNGRTEESNIFEGAIYLREVVVYDEPVDYTRFSLGDVRVLLNHLIGIPAEEDLEEYEVEVIERHDPTCIFDVTKEQEELVGRFVRNSFKRYINDDDFI